MKNRSLLTALAATAAIGAGAAVTPLWMRDVKASPDGSTVAFRYGGDIYTVPATGGRATRVTTHPAMDKTPVWSPDGRSLAFASDRDGAMNIYIVPADGGEPQRVTTGSTNLVPQAFTPDGSAIVYSASIQDPVTSRLFPTARLTELYRVGVNGGASTQILASPAEMIAWLPDGKSFLYQDQKGMESAWRKHHTSSVTRDIWRYDAATGKHTNLTAHAGEDREPALSPDGKTVYFLSERDGDTMNVWAFDLDNPATSLRRVTSHSVHPVRFLSVAPDGTLFYGWDGEIYRKAPGAEPAKVTVTLTGDPGEQIDYVGYSTFSDGAPSPDGKEVAVVNRGNIAVTSAEYSTTRRITADPFTQKHVSWHPDGRKIVFASDSTGLWDIYEATISRPEEVNFSGATLVDVKPVAGREPATERSRPKFSPDGKRLAFVKDREQIWVMDTDGRNARMLTDGSGVTYRSDDVEYNWSPDGKWIVTTIVDKMHDPYYDIALLNVESGEITNLTRTGYFDWHPQFAFGGNAIVFTSDRYGMRSHASWGSQEDVMAIFLNQDALDRFKMSEEEYKLMKESEKLAKKNDTPAENKKAPKKGKKGKKETSTESDDSAPQPIVVELDGIHDRIVRLTPNSSELGGFAVTGDDGEETLYYLSAFEEGYDLWKRNLRKGDTKIASKLNTYSPGLETDKDGKQLFFIGGRAVSRMGVSDEQVKPVTFAGTMPVDLKAEREGMYDYLIREEAKRFYVKDMHGVDWEGLTESYRRFLPHITNNYDMAEMLSELLGELNVSHTGSSYSPPGSDEPSGTLGLLYDLAYTGPGMKVAEVVKGTPFARAGSKVRPGVVVTKVQGTAVDTDNPLEVILKGKIGKPVLVELLDPATGKSWEEAVKPISPRSMNDRLYTRWVDRNRALVDSLSGGRLGYVHLRNMSDASFRTIYSDLLGRYNDREAVVIDTRWNGGGRLHEDIEVLFSGEQYFTQEVHGKATGAMPSRRWNKPSIMLICEANYSNAHGTPWVYKHKGLGKLVGAPVPGTMTSVNWVDLRDDSLLFGIPVTGMKIADGTYLENKQLEPDILILNDPAEVVAGRDAQIEGAVKELLRELDSKKK